MPEVRPATDNAMGRQQDTSRRQRQGPAVVVAVPARLRQHHRLGPALHLVHRTSQEDITMSGGIPGGVGEENLPVRQAHQIRVLDVVLPAIGLQRELGTPGAGPIHRHLRRDPARRLIAEARRSVGWIPQHVGGPVGVVLTPHQQQTAICHGEDQLMIVARVLLRPRARHRFEDRCEQSGHGFGGDVQIRTTSVSRPVFSIPCTHQGGR